MRYKTKDKTTMHIRLSRFLYNGLDVLSAKLDMSMSEIVRMAIYEYIKNNFDKKEIDILSDRDDVVSEWVDMYRREKGRAGGIVTGYEYPEWALEDLKKGKIEAYEEKEDGKIIKIPKKEAIQRIEKQLEIDKKLMEKLGIKKFSQYREYMQNNPETYEQLTMPAIKYDDLKLIKKEEKKKKNVKKKSK